MSALLSEVMDALADYGHLWCRPSVDTDADGYVVLTVRLKPDEQADTVAAMETLAVLHELEYVVDVAQMRQLAEKYDIPSARLEALLPPKGGTT